MSLKEKIVIRPFQKEYVDDVTIMMDEINKEFSLPAHHPCYQRKEPDYYWLAFAGEQIAGSVAVLMMNDYAVLKSMFVKKDFRGKGLGIAAMLLDKALTQCADKNKGRVYLGTLEVLIAAQKFYEKSGFEKISFEELPDNFPHNLSDNVFYSVNTILVSK